MARLDCEKIKDLLLDYDEGFLEEDNCQEIAAHLESCKDCADYYRELKDSWQTLAKVELPEIEPTPNYQERFWRKTESEGIRVFPRKRNLFPYIFALAASLACVFGLAVMYIFANPNMPNRTTENYALEDRPAAVSEVGEVAEDYYQGDFIYAEYTEQTDDLLSQDLLDSAMKEVYF